MESGFVYCRAAAHMEGVNARSQSVSPDVHRLPVAFNSFINTKLWLLQTHTRRLSINTKQETDVRSVRSQTRSSINVSSRYVPSRSQTSFLSDSLLRLHTDDQMKLIVTSRTLEFFFTR